jgi:hypothetical protein
LIYIFTGILSAFSSNNRTKNIFICLDRLLEKPNKIVLISAVMYCLIVVRIHERFNDRK